MRFAFIIAVSFIFISISYSQVLDVSATIELEHLNEEAQNELANFTEKIEDYYNAYQWTEDEFEYDVTCKVQIIVETVQQKAAEKLYRAQFLISSVSGESYYDKTWEFPYNRSVTLSHIVGQFDPIAAFLDYYGYMILAGEMDTNGYLLGNSFYEQAQEICNRALLSKYSRGWQNRKNELLKVTDIRTRPLREVKPDLFEALYLLEENKKDEAKEYANKVLVGIEKVYKVQPNNWYLQMFFKSQYRKMALLFQGNNRKLELLEKMDSKHRDTYRSFK
jgi:hypothetical protein